MTEQTSSRSFADILFDAFLILAAFIFLTGGSFMLHGNLLILIGQKPWLHRLAVTGLATAALLFFYLRMRSKAAPTPLLYFFQKIRFSPFQWTVALFFWLSWIWTSSAWLRHDSFQSGFDLAIFAQAIWNTAHGHFLFSSLKGDICLLGDHFSPLLAVFAVTPGPKALLMLQAVAAASSVFPLYLMAARRLERPSYGLIFAVLFALYLPVRNAVRFDFHPEIFATPFLLWAFYFFETQKTGWASLFLLLLLSSKENAALVVFSFGFYAVLKGKRLWGFFWCVFSALYFLSVVRLLIPKLSGQPYFYLDGNFFSWKDAGAGAFLKQVLGPGSIAYLVKILAPLGFLSILDPAGMLLAAPSLLQNLTARNEMVHSIFFQYTAYLTPALFIAAINGSRRFASSKGFPFYLIAVAILMSGVSDLYVLKSYTRWKEPHFAAAREYLKKFPQGSVRTHELFAPHLAGRQELHIFENHHPREGGRAKALQAEYVVLDERLGATPADFSELAKLGYVDFYTDGGGFRVFRKTP